MGQDSQMKQIAVIAALLCATGCSTIIDMWATTEAPNDRTVASLHVTPKNCVMLKSFIDRAWQARNCDRRNCGDLNQKRMEYNQTCSSAE